MLRVTLVLLFLNISGILLSAQPVFKHQVLDDNISIGYGLAIGDVDGDKQPDILLADKKQFVWYRNGDWKRFVLIENITEADNVCIAARDIDGDGKVEIAVGAQWNPGETSDPLKSGSVHFLEQPADPTQKWKAVPLHHEPTVHRMKWVMVAPNDFRLIVVPLHGRGNVNGQGTPVKILAYQKPKSPTGAWTYETVDHSMHLTHNFDIVKSDDRELIAVGGKEGMKFISFRNNKWDVAYWLFRNSQFGETRVVDMNLISGIEPMHGNRVTVYESGKRIVVDSTLRQGHALAFEDVIGSGQKQVIAGWREPDSEGNTGIRIYTRGSDSWQSGWIDQNGIACEDLVVTDLNGDGRLDIVAAGRATKNLKIYWNQRP